ncbi:flagellar capping protein [compost metagenome]
MTGKDGLISRMTKATENFALSKTGVFAARTTALSKTLEELTTQQASLDARMASLSDSLTKKYTAMDSLVAKLKATSSSIMTTLNALNKVDSD